MTGEEYINLNGRAHRALFDEYYSYVYTVVLSKLHGYSHEDVEECVSDVFAEVFMSLDGGGYSGELKGFICTVAKRRAIDSFRKLSAGKRSFFVSLDDDEFSKIISDNNIEEDTEQSDLARLLLEKIESLGEPDSTIIIRKFYAGENSGQIAAALGMKPSAVRMRSTRALKSLKKLLKGVI